MLNLIDIRTKHTIRFNEVQHREDQEAFFTIKIDDNISVIVKLNLPEEKADVEIRDYTVEDEVFIALQEISSTDLNDFPGEVAFMIKKINTYTTSATRKVLSLIKYYMGHREIAEQLISVNPIEWKTGQGSWRILPSKYSIATEMFNTYPLNEERANTIQEALDGGITPLLAMRHLQRAEGEPIPRYKWIEATTAAELAVKEVLILKVPILEKLLLEVPSPPLSKLYKSLLEEYLGESSPFYKDISKGVEVRNRLIHKPTEEQIDLQEAIDYVGTIKKAISHMLSILYTDNLHLQNMVKKI